MDYKHLVEKIEENNFNYSSLAKKIGVSRSGLLNSIENQTLTVLNLENICEALHMDPRMFFHPTEIKVKTKTLSIDEYERYKVKYFEKLEEIEELKKSLTQ